MPASLQDQLHRLLNPRSVAVIGASEKPGSVGGSIVTNILGGNFTGTLLAVNPKYDSVLGVRCYHDARELPPDIDCVVIATPAPTVAAIIQSLAEKNCGGAVVISTGFSGHEKNATQYQEELRKAALQTNIPLLGPNCLGFIRPSSCLNASFARTTARAGSIAFLSQSGALCTAILDWSNKNFVGFSAFVSIGDMLTVGFSDLITYFANDPQTASIIMYMESVTNPQEFLKAANRASEKKPLIILKSGRSVEGTSAAKSHTGSIAGSDSVFDAAFEKAGILRVKTIGELFDAALTLDMQHLPTGPRMTILTNAGGPGVIATDALIERGGTLAKLDDQTIKNLNAVLPVSWSGSNPVDILGDADANRYKQALDILTNDPHTDGILVILTPQSMTNPVDVATTLSQYQKQSNVILLASWMGEGDVDEGRAILEKARIPVYKIPENAVRSFMNMVRYQTIHTSLQKTPRDNPQPFVPHKEKVAEIIQLALSEGRLTLNEFESKHILSSYDIPVVRGSIAHTEEEAILIARSLGYPVVAKISSPDILHKTDVGGKLLDLTSDDHVSAAFHMIMEKVPKKVPEAKIDGVLIEAQIKRQFELIIGAKQDPLFGLAILFGMGGIAVDIYQDTAIALPPLDQNDALSLINKTRVSKLLKGFRGQQGIDMTELAFVLVKFSTLLRDFPNIREIDINPFSVDTRGGMVLDAKIILSGRQSGS